MERLVGETQAKYEKLKEENTPLKIYKKWTEAEEAQLIRLVREFLTIKEIELAQQREAAEQIDTQRPIAMAKVRDPDKLLLQLEQTPQHQLHLN